MASPNKKQIPVAQLDLAGGVVARPGARLTQEQVEKASLRLLELSNDIEMLKPDQVVEDARAEDSPLHEFFTWDDNVAGERYRMQQARLLMSACTYRVKMLGKDMVRHQPMLVRVEKRDAKKKLVDKGYMHVTKALLEPEYRQQMLESAARELQRWERVHARTVELIDAVESVRAVRISLEKFIAKMKK